MKILLLILFLPALVAGQGKSPATIAKLVSDDLLSRPDYMLYKVETARAIHYAEACTAFGAIRIASLLDNEYLLEQLSYRYRKAVTDSIGNTENHVDVNVYGIVPLELFIQGEDSVFLRDGIHLADGQWEDPRPDGLTSQTRFWIDDVYMIGSLQVQAYRATGDMKYLDRAALELSTYIENLQQHNGLFHHGENGPFFWGRGNGWVAAGLAEVLMDLPVNHVNYDVIAAGYNRMMEALLHYQADDGMWRQLIDVEESWKETSCTGMFGYAMATGVKKGILPAAKYDHAYKKAWSTLSGYVQPDGKVTDVCVGTGQSMDKQFYLDRPTVTGDFHGQAPLLWFAWILLQP